MKRTPIKRTAKLKARKPLRKRAKQSTLRAKCDAAWSRAVRAMANYECAICGRHGINPNTGQPYKLEAHHIIPKGTSAFFRHNVENGLCLCVLCHKWESPGPHHSPGAFEEWMKKNQPARYEWWMKNRHATLPAFKPDYSATLASLESMGGAQ